MVSGLGTVGAATLSHGSLLMQEQEPGGGGGGAVQAEQATVVVRKELAVPQAALVLTWRYNGPLAVAVTVKGVVPHPIVAPSGVP